MTHLNAEFDEILKLLKSLFFTDSLDFLKVVRLVFWSFARSLALRARSLALRARTIALRAHFRATRSKARLVSKSTDS